MSDFLKFIRGKNLLAIYKKSFLYLTEKNSCYVNRLILNGLLMAQKMQETRNKLPNVMYSPINLYK